MFFERGETRKPSDCSGSAVCGMQFFFGENGGRAFLLPSPLGLFDETVKPRRRAPAGRYCGQRGREGFEWRNGLIAVSQSSSNTPLLSAVIAFFTSLVSP